MAEDNCIQGYPLSSKTFDVQRNNNNGIFSVSFQTLCCMKNVLRQMLYILGHTGAKGHSQSS